MPRPAEAIVRAYRTRLDALRDEIAARIARLYGDEVDPGDLAASIDAFIDRAAPVIAAGQASAAALTAAFIARYSRRLLPEFELEDVDELAGQTEQAKPLAEGMAAFGPMILTQIRQGRTLEEAIEFGRYLATRFAENEVTGAADRTTAAQTSRSGRFRSWEGIVSAGACDPCIDNAGVHDIDVEIYRHPGCRCVYVPLIDVSA